MLKKTITYKDFEGTERTDDFYFHLSKADLIELEVSEEDGLEEYLKDIMKTEDKKEILRIFKGILKLAVGKKSKDGRLFERNDKITNEFMMSNAYGELLLEVLTTDDNAASKFINAVVEP